LSVAGLKEMKLWEAKQRSIHGLGFILTTCKMTTSHSTVKCPLVLLENAPKIPFFSSPELHFEKGSKIKGDEALGGKIEVHTWSWGHTNYPHNDNLTLNN